MPPFVEFAGLCARVRRVLCCCSWRARLASRGGVAASAVGAGFICASAVRRMYTTRATGATVFNACMCGEALPVHRSSVGDAAAWGAYRPQRTLPAAHRLWHCPRARTCGCSASVWGRVLAHRDELRSTAAVEESGGWRGDATVSCC
jgi:hypothetical protein